MTQCFGPAPFGYHKLRGTHVLTKDNEQQAEIAFAHDLKKSGGLTWGELCAELNNQGSKTPQGKLWTIDNVRKLFGEAFKREGYE